MTRAQASGTVRLDGVTVIRRDQSTQFLTMPKLTLALKQVDAVAQTVALGNLAVEGLDVRVIRDAAGKVDLVELVDAISAPAPAAPPVPSPAPTRSVKRTGSSQPPAAVPWKISLDRFDYTKGTPRSRTERLSDHDPDLDGLTAKAERVAFPSTAPATFDLRSTCRAEAAPR